MGLTLSHLRVIRYEDLMKIGASVATFTSIKKRPFFDTLPAPLVRGFFMPFYVSKTGFIIQGFVYCGNNRLMELI